jgi:hypothetical protein
MGLFNVRPVLALVLMTGPASAGVVYDVTHRTLMQPPTAPEVAQYFVQDDKVRVGASDAMAVLIFKNKTVYVIDNTLRSVQALKNATLEQIAAKFADNVKRLEDAAATAPPGQRAMGEGMAANMKELGERERQPVPRDYRLTNRAESVDGHGCRIWEERESGAKRLEFCVASLEAVPGGADILHGMKVLSQYWHGSTFALGVEFGPAVWWSGIEGLGGVPILIREFKDGTAVAETTLTGMRPDVPNASLFDIPDGYPLREQPLGAP